MSRIALVGENTIEYVQKLIEIWNNNDCAVLFDVGISYEKAIEMLKDANIEKCIIEEKIFRKWNVQSTSSICFITYTINEFSEKVLPQDIYNNYRENYSHSDALVLYSSGTTGSSKGIILSHYAISTNADAITKYMKLMPYDCIYIARPLNHSSTIIGELLVALKSKIKIILERVVVPPRYILRNISKYNVTIIGINPNMLKMIIKEYNLSHYNLFSLKKIYVSGSLLSDKLYNEAHKLFHFLKIYNVYGLTEAAPRVTAQRENCCKSNSVGKPLNGIQIAIVNECGNLVSKSERGIIHVKTPCLFSGYVIGKEKNKSLYKNWLNTGDVGYIDINNELHVCGRIDDVIIIDSHKIYPSDVESIICNNTFINDCVVIKYNNTGNETLICIYEGTYVSKIDIISKIKNKLLPYEIPKIFIKFDILPRNKNGKIIRNEIYTILDKNYNLGDNK